jgi:hypothetical protein
MGLHGLSNGQLGKKKKKEKKKKKKKKEKKRKEKRKNVALQPFWTLAAFSVS